MRLLKGKKIADKILRDLKIKIKKFPKKPALAAVLTGKNKASETYVSLKKKAAEKVGIGFFVFRFGAKSKEKKIIEKIKELDADEKISGVIVQLPLPEKYNAPKILKLINPKKDADGFSKKSPVAPAFPTAIMKMLEAVPKVEPSEKAVVISNSEIFGKTMKNILKNKNIQAEFILAEELKIPLNPPFEKGENKREGFLRKIKSADIVITAVGKPGLLTGEMVKDGVIIIDGGITKHGKKVLGDVDFESVKNIAGYLSPVPGGVGPVTIACLLENGYLLMKKQGK